MEYLNISRIYVIQSLVLSEVQTGDKIKEDVDGYIAYAGHPISCVLKNVYDIEDLFSCLNEIAAYAGKSNFPVVHFECHGSQNGLQLASGQNVSWPELNEKLTAINIQSRLNLIVVFGLCYGAHFIRSMDALDRSPCLMFFGPTETILTHELITSLSEFYRFLICECDGTKSFKALASKTLEAGGFSMTTCIHFFRRVVELYYEETKGGEAERARRIRKTLLKKENSKKFSVGSIKRSLIRYEKEFIRKLYDRYFFADLYPENRNRFTQLIGIEKISLRRRDGS